TQYGLIDNWLRNIKSVIKNRKSELDSITDEQENFDKMCEFNVMEQVANVGHTTVLESMWKEGKEVRVHGLIYALNTGKLKDLELTISNPDELAQLDKNLNYG
ncbi:MAG: carbonate dehydratase, partial [Lentisphaeraceae bacterium]|nr:carbonate dehydratase [Lentisphaeraceae bacterium]